MLKYSPYEKHNNHKIQRPFTLEKIKKGLNNKSLKEVLLQKTRDPLIKRNIPKIREKIELYPSDEIKMYNPKKENPNIFNCLLKVSIFARVNPAGWFPVFIAYCSAGKPKASHPIGCNTL